jgi:excisionase family DNA binding protein
MARPSFRDHLADNLAGMEPILVPVPQASAIIGKCQRAIYELIASGQLKAVKSGRNTLVVYESLKEYVANLPSPKLKQYVPKAR